MSELAIEPAAPQQRSMDMTPKIDEKPGAHLQWIRSSRTSKSDSARSAAGKLPHSRDCNAKPARDASESIQHLKLHRSRKRSVGQKPQLALPECRPDCSHSQNGQSAL
jgi:hypothetical protein